MASRFDPLTDIVDLKGKVIVVTGGNKGIGYATVQHLARGGAKVYLAARNEERARKAIEALRHDGFEPGNGDIVWLELDLSEPQERKAVCRKVFSDRKAVGCFEVSAPYQLTSDGVTTLCTVNYISPFVFTRTLLPLLMETAKEPGSDVRIVNLTSIVHKLVTSVASFKTRNDFNLKYAMSPLSGMQRYGLTKLMMLLWTMTLKERLSATYPSAPITVIAVHPGGVDTFTHNWPFPTFSRWLVGLAIADPVRGAYNSVFAAASKKVANEKDKYCGAYLESNPTGRITEVGKPLQNEDLRTQLWRATERFLEDLGL